jgi:hypothetical protein
MMLVGSSLFWLVLMAHLLGDFYFQSSQLAQRKNDGSFGALAAHSCYYAAIVLLLPWLFYGLNALILGAALAIIHFLIDWIKLLVSSRNKQSLSPRLLFFCDQFAHLITIVIATIVFLLLVDTSYSPVTFWLQSLYQELQVTLLPDKLMRFVVVLLFLMRPVNIAIRVFGSKEQPGEGTKDGAADLRAGRCIGILERLIVLILALYGQYSAIAFVFAAKSIARFKKIEDDPTFAEYYLMGTLFSALAAILGAIIINL